MILVKLKGRYEEWVKNGYFKPSEDKSKETYTIVIPPPNVTGKLHLDMHGIQLYKISLHV